MLASTIGAATASAISGTAAAGFATIGSLACGPFLVAFVVGVAAGYALYRLDEYLHIHEKFAEAYDARLTKLAQFWRELGAEAHRRFDQLANRHFVHDLRQDADVLAAKLARGADRVRGELVRLW